jgi:hypothetical protein
MEYYYSIIDKYLLHSFLLVLLASALVFKNLNEHLLTTLVLAIFEVFSDVIEEPLFEFSLSLGVHEGRIVWYFSWVLVNLLAVKFIDFSHNILSFSSDRLVNAIRFSFLAFALIHFVSFIFRYIIDNEIVDNIILTSKFSVQIGVVSILLIGLLKSGKYKSKFIPKGSHNRSVKWYQELMLLPPEKRVNEFIKWQEYTQSLDTIKTIRRVK